MSDQKVSVGDVYSYEGALVTVVCLYPSVEYIILGAQEANTRPLLGFMRQGKSYQDWLSGRLKGRLDNICRWMTVEDFLARATFVKRDRLFAALFC